MKKTVTTACFMLVSGGVLWAWTNGLQKIQKNLCIDLLDISYKSNVLSCH